MVLSCKRIPTKMGLIATYYARDECLTPITRCCVIRRFTECGREERGNLPAANIDSKRKSATALTSVVLALENSRQRFCRGNYVRGPETTSRFDGLACTPACLHDMAVTQHGDQFSSLCYCCYFDSDDAFIVIDCFHVTS